MVFPIKLNLAAEFDKMNKARVVAALIALGSFIFYSYFAYPTISAGDSGDLILAAYKFGIPHSPGYPLYTVLASLWIRLVPLGSIAWRMNVFSALFSSLTLMVLFLLVYTITRRLLAALFSSLFLMTAYTYWQFSVTTEVFAMNNFFVLLIFYLLLLWRRRVGQTLRNNAGRLSQMPPGALFSLPLLYWCVLIGGLGIAHHHMIVLFVPAYFYLFFTVVRDVVVSFNGLGKFWAYLQSQWKFLIKALLTMFLLVLVGLSFYAYLFLSTRYQSDYLWRPVATLSDLRATFFREEYGTFSIAQKVEREWGNQRRYFVVYPKLLETNFSILGMILAGLGFLVGMRRWRVANLAGGMAFLFCFGFLLFASLPFYSLFNLGQLEKFSTVSLLWIPVWQGMALSWGQRKFGPSIYILPVLLFGYLLAVNLTKLDLRQVRQGEYFAKDALGPLKNDALVFPSGDDLILNSFYVHYVEDYRPDIRIVYGRGNSLAYLLEKLQKRTPGLVTDFQKGEDEFLTLIKENINRFPIYTSFAVNLPDFKFIPRGLFYEVLPSDSSYDLQEVFDSFLAFINNSSFLVNYDDAFAYPAQIKSLRGYYSGACVHAADFFFNQEEKKKALTLYLKSNEIMKNYRASLNAGSLLAEEGECLRAENLFKTALEYAKTDEMAPKKNLFILYRDCYGDKDRAEEFLEEISR